MTEHALTLAGGVAMPVIGLGTWQSRDNQCYQAVLDALELGYRHIDTATMYRNEDQVATLARRRSEALAR